MRLILALALLGSLAGCGSSLTCQTAKCSNNANTYQTCTNINATITYNFGGMSCNCSPTSCTTCASEIANFCGAGGGGGSGGSGGGGGSGGSGGSGGNTNCMLTLSGANSGTYACDITLGFDSSKSQSAFAISVPAPSPFATITGGATITGMAAMGTYTQATTAASAIAVQNSSQATWDESFGNNDPDQGSFSLDFTSVTGSGVLLTGHGTLMATLPANPQTANAMGTTMMSATF
jgi:hypothetical protein